MFVCYLKFPNRKKVQETASKATCKQLTRIGYFHCSCIPTSVPTSSTHPTRYLGSLLLQVQTPTAPRPSILIGLIACAESRLGGPTEYAA